MYPQWVGDITSGAEPIARPSASPHVVGVVVSKECLDCRQCWRFAGFGAKRGGISLTRTHLSAAHKEMTAWSVYGKIIDMTRSKGPSPRDNKSAEQGPVQTARAVASGAMRIPRASVQIAGQLPDLLENLAIAIERLNTMIDRAERYMALADPMVRTMDRLLPRLEALVAAGNDVYKALSSIPGVYTLSRHASGRSSDEREDDNRSNNAGH